MKTWQSGMEFRHWGLQLKFIRFVGDQPGDDKEACDEVHGRSVLAEILSSPEKIREAIIGADVSNAKVFGLTESELPELT